MKISREWLSDYVDLTGLSDDELGRKMTEIGHAIEAVESDGDDTIFDVEFTTNRIDATSHAGLARELGAAFGRELIIPVSTRSFEEDPALSVPVTIEAADLCTRYSGLVIRDVAVKPSSHLIERRLTALGMRPINNIVDITNYVMRATGHPMHAFDLDKLSGGRIEVRRGRPGEKLVALDGVTHELDGETVVIADAREAVALGGVIGGIGSSVTESTRNIFLECAWFSPSAIRRASRKLGVRTDASYRFERRVDPADTVASLRLAAELIQSEAGGRRGVISDVVAAEDPVRRLTLRSERLRVASAGVIGIGYALELFRRLGFQASPTADGIDVVVPTYRGDLEEEIDLIEEVLRFHGLDAIPSSLPRLTTGDVRRDPMQEACEKLRDLLSGCGLSEAITYSFNRSSHNGLFSDEEPLSITNALTENLDAMRLSLLPGLLESVAHNWAYGNRDGGVFELGRTYHSVQGKVRERPVAAFVLFGSSTVNWDETKRVADYFDAKGIIETIASRFHVELALVAADQKWMKNGQGSLVRSGAHPIAAVGVVSREVAEQFGLKGEIVAAEIDIEELLASGSDWKMTPVSRFPGMPMVLGVMHSTELSYQQLVERIATLNVEYLAEVGLRDRFIPPGSEGIEVKTTLGMWYQAPDRSLTQDEVQKIHRTMASRLGELLPVKLIVP